HLAKVEVASSSLVARSSSGIPLTAPLSASGGKLRWTGNSFASPSQTLRWFAAGAPVLRRIASLAAGMRGGAKKFFGFFSKKGGLFLKDRI
ncbi:hypothetical protein, partial [uncultured Oscillibacter sp.]|uniref:hypothetical protein n=1 Tax=uncultured Oscillibacter sp. TaxID=876091 RepID=UPI0025FFFB2D